MSRYARRMLRIASGVILMIAETTFNSLHKAHILEDVARGQKFVNGIAVRNSHIKDAA